MLQELVEFGSWWLPNCGGDSARDAQLATRAQSGATSLSLGEGSSAHATTQLQPQRLTRLPWHRHVPGRQSTEPAIPLSSRRRATPAAPMPPRTSANAPRRIKQLMERAGKAGGARSRCHRGPATCGRPSGAGWGCRGRASPEKRGEWLQLLLLGAPRHSKGTSTAGRGGEDAAARSAPRRGRRGPGRMRAGREKSQVMEEAGGQALLQGGPEPS